MERETTLQNQPSWIKFLQLWTVIYVFIFILTSQFGWPFAFIEKFTVWFSKMFLHLDNVSKIKNTGSGDTLYDYVLTLECVLLSGLAAIVVLIADRRRASYRQLYLFTIVIARYYVAFTMLSYGFAKVFNGQFPPNGYGRLEQKVGDMSPMGMVWAFMGASRSYTFISGVLECTGGLLLLFRKTQTLGALFSLTVMTNVALLNYNYDVPVKIFSTHIVLLCLFILSFDLKKLYLFFFRHQSVHLSYNRLHTKKKWVLILLRGVKILLIGYIFYSNISGLWPTLKPSPAPMAGAYNVHFFILGGDTTVSYGVAKDTTSWSKILVDYPGYVAVQNNKGDKTWFNAKIDTTRKIFSLQSKGFTEMDTLSYQIIKDTVLFHGTLHREPLDIISTRKSMKDYSLPSRGFHWVNTYPPNW